MSITKNNIINKIKKSSSLSISEAARVLESFLYVTKSKSKSKSVKLSGFGTFCFKKTPKRIGRNPKTQDSYIIPEINKLNFKPSKKVKEQIN